jgi:subtilase family serine protease
MQTVQKTKGLSYRAEIIAGGPVGWRRSGAVVLAALAALLFSPNQRCSAAESTIELSPTVAKSTLLSSVNSGQQITAVFTLPLGDSQGAADFVWHVSTPGDPLFRKYITAQEFAIRYGANAADFAAVKEWAAANNLEIVHEGYARTILAVRGTVAQFETLFKTQINNYRSPDGQAFYSAGVAPTIPSAISSKISGVIGLTSSLQYTPHDNLGKVFGENADSGPVTNTIGGTGPGGGYSASDLRTIYSIPAIGKLSPQKVAVFEQGGFTASDVTTYIERMKLPKAKVTQIGVNNYEPGTINTDAIELEAVLDVDLTLAINPDVAEVIAYEDGNAGDPLDVALVLTFDQVASDAKVQTLSVSYFEDEAQAGDTAMAAENTALEGLASTGTSVLASSGDLGAYGNVGLQTLPVTLNVEDPASQPLVTGVGGTTLFTGPKEVYDLEVVWSDLEGYPAGFATGGGVSSYWTIPTWQTSANFTPDGGSSTYRNVPDVAAVADLNTGVAVYSKANGGWLAAGGTGASAAIWGGYISLLNSAATWLGIGKLGFFNPTLYNSNPAYWLYNIASGSNGNAVTYDGTAGYTASIFYLYNNCTGGGSLWGDDFEYAALTSGGSGTPPGPLTGVTVTNVTEHSAELSWDAASEATGYVVNNFYKLPSGTEDSVYKSPTFVLDSKTTKLVLTGLAPGITYYPSIAAVNSGGASQFFLSQGFQVK